VAKVEINKFTWQNCCSRGFYYWFWHL